MFESFWNLSNSDGDTEDEHVSVGEIGLDTQEQIFDLIFSEFGYGPAPLAKLGTILSEAGIRPADYGFEKLKPFLSACKDAVVLDNDPNSGLPIAFVNQLSDLALHAKEKAGGVSDSDTAQASVPLAIQAAAAEAVSKKFGSGKAILLAEVGTVLSDAGIVPSTYGYRKLKPFLAACDEVFVVGNNPNTGHPTVLVKGGELPIQNDSKPGRKRGSANIEENSKVILSDETLTGRVIHIGVHSNGSDYGIAESELGTKYLFFDNGVRGNHCVRDFAAGDLVVFSLFTNKRGRTYASDLARASNGTSKRTNKTPQSSSLKLVKSLPDEVQRELYLPLVRRFGFSKSAYPLAEFGTFLNEIFFDYGQYGFDKAKPFALALDKIMSISYAAFGEVAHPYFSLIRVPEWENDARCAHDNNDNSTRESASNSGHPFNVEQTLRESGRTDRAKIYGTVKKVPDRSSLFAFAKFDDWLGSLKSLSQLALDEEWGIRKGSDYEVLDNYLRYTFFRLKEEGKVLVSCDESCAVFNTGLVDELYDDIFACFSSQVRNGGFWHFEGFCTEGSFSGPAECLDSFSPLPEPAAYFENIEDLLFNPKIKIRPNYTHILLDNMERLPLSFLKNELSSFDEAIGYIKQIESIENEESDEMQDMREELYESLSAYIEGHARCMRRLVDRLRASVNAAEKRARWNYKNAVPVYYSRLNRVTLLLPLDLTDDGAPDVALVIERDSDDQAYRGRTIYTLDMAYKNARLVCRLDNDWLVTSIS